MRTRLVLTTGFAAVTLFVLAACTPGTGVPTAGEPGTTDEPGGPGGIGSGSLTDCLQGTWELDVDDLVAQLQETLIANGTPITTSVADGGATLSVSGDEMIYDSDVTYTMSADADGLPMVVAQTHQGVSNGLWAEEGGDLVFSEWENSITIITAITVGGVEAGEPTVIPGGIDNGVVMAVACDGDTLTTQPEESPYISTWARVG
jgi:hypothetical protein